MLTVVGVGCLVVGENDLGTGGTDDLSQVVAQHIDAVNTVCAGFRVTQQRLLERNRVAEIDCAAVHLLGQIEHTRRIQFLRTQNTECTIQFVANRVVAALAPVDGRIDSIRTFLTIEVNQQRVGLIVRMCADKQDAL